MTRRLYHEDAYLRRFEGEVLAVTAWKGRPAVILDRTAFYPEAGGQLGDRGTLGGLEIVDTQETDAGIAHVLGGDPPAIGTRVTGELDWARRRQHMAQHTAQHLLSGALLDRAAAPTASARLGESALTIDAARDRIPDAELAAAEDLANDLIDDDLPIRAWFPPPDELAGLRKQEFGTAVLSRWTIEDARKIDLPHAAFITNLRRAVTHATLRCGERRIVAMSLHLSAPLGLSYEDRQHQVETILEHTRTMADPVSVAGDFNARWVGELFEKAGFDWLSRDLPGTASGLGMRLKYDHVFARGFKPAPGGPAAGVGDAKGSSDHHPVWVRLQLPLVP